MLSVREDDQTLWKLACWLYSSILLLCSLVVNPCTQKGLLACQCMPSQLDEPECRHMKV